MSISSSNRNQSSGLRSNSIARKRFKCTAPCLYLPGFSKKRTVVHQPSENSCIEPEKMPQKPCKEPHPDSDSTLVCATDEEITGPLPINKTMHSSCNSGIIFNLVADEEGWKSPMFDLPVELIKGRNSDSKQPVNAAFVFSCDPKSEMKTKTALLIAQSRSLQLKNKSSHLDEEFARPSVSCPTSPMGLH